MLTAQSRWPEEVPCPLWWTGVNLQAMMVSRLKGAAQCVAEADVVSLSVGRAALRVQVYVAGMGVLVHPEKHIDTELLQASDVAEWCDALAHRVRKGEYMRGGALLDMSKTINTEAEAQARYAALMQNADPPPPHTHGMPDPEQCHVVPFAGWPDERVRQLTVTLTVDGKDDTAYIGQWVSRPRGVEQLRHAIAFLKHLLEIEEKQL